MRGGHHAVQQVAILGRCLRSAWWLRVTVSCLFKKAHGPRPLHRPPSIFGKHPLQKWSFRDTLTHRTKQSVQHVWTPPTVHVRYIRYISYFPTDRDRPSFRDIRTDPRPTSAVHVRYIRYTSWTGGDRLRNIIGGEELGCSRWSFTRIGGGKCSLLE